MSVLCDIKDLGLEGKQLPEGVAETNAQSDLPKSPSLAVHLLQNILQPCWGGDWGYLRRAKTDEESQYRQEGRGLIGFGRIRDNCNKSEGTDQDEREGRAMQLNKKHVAGC